VSDVTSEVVFGTF